jgi:uncharacterized protein YcfL
MKKLIVLVITILLSLMLVSCSSNKDTNTNKSERELRKGYKEAKIYIYDYEFGEIDYKSKELRYNDTYDEQGNIITRKEFWGDDDYTKIVYKYNDKGLLIENNVFTVNKNEDEKLELTTKYKYNDNGLVIEKTDYKQGEPRCVLIYEYN